MVQTAALTLFGGVIILLLTEIVKGLFFKPMQVLNEHIVTIIDRIFFYSNRLTNYNDSDDPEVANMASHLRSAAAQLKAKQHALKWRPLWSLLRFTPNDRALSKVYRDLIALSNGIPTEYKSKNSSIDFIHENHKHIESIGKALGFKFD